MAVDGAVEDVEERGFSDGPEGEETGLEGGSIEAQFDFLAVDDDVEFAGEGRGPVVGRDAYVGAPTSGRFCATAVTVSTAPTWKRRWTG